MPLPRKFLNDDEDLLAELRPHWVFFAGPLLVSVLVVAAIVAVLVAAPSMPNWASDVLMALAAIPLLWLLGRLLRWRTYTLALTTTRIVVRRGVLARHTVQIRLQRITEISLSQKLWERMVSTGRLIIDVQGEDDSIVLEFVRQPDIVQRVINGQINELVGGGSAEPIPSALRPFGGRSEPAAPIREAQHDTPPFGVPMDTVRVGPTMEPPAPVVPGGSGPAEIRDRLIELDDLRRRNILSEDEFAAKKAELLSRI